MNCTNLLPLVIVLLLMFGTAKCIMQNFTAPVEVLPGFTFRWFVNYTLSSAYVVGEFNFSDRGQWGAIGMKSDCGMDGLSVICFLNAGGATACQDWSGSGNSISVSNSNLATALNSTSTAGGGASIVWQRIVESNGVDLGVAAWGTPARVIFGLGPMSSKPERHVGREMVSAALADFKTGYVTFDAPNPGAYLGAIIAALAVTLVLMIVSLGVRHFKLHVHHRVRTAFGFAMVGIYLGIWVWYIFAAAADYKKMGKLSAQASATGDGAAAAFAVLLISGSRRFITQDLIGVSHERMIIYHTVAGLGFLLTLCIHGGLMLQMFDVEYTGQWPSAFIAPLPGLLAGVVTSILVATSLLRNQISYRVFRATHVLWTVVVIFLLLHVPGLYAALLPGLALLFLNLIYGRAANSRCRIVSARRHFASELTEVLVARPHVRLFDTGAVPSMGMAAGQWMYLHVSNISLLWHPFSIAEARIVDDEQQLRFFVKSTGNKLWTDALGLLVHTPPSELPEASVELTSLSSPIFFELPFSPSGDISTLKLRLEGPFGRLQLPLDAYPDVMFVSGGVGITPNLLCLQEMSERIVSEPGRWRRLLWVFTAQNPATINIFFPYMAEYLSKLIAHGVETKIVINCSRGTSSSIPPDPLLGEVAQGRPNLLLIFTDWMSTETAAMYVCGPDRFMDDTKKAAQTVGRIYIHDEVFSM